MSTLEMASSGSPISGLRLRVAEALWRAAMAVLALMPVGMAIAHRSSPVFLALGAACSLGAIAAEGRLPSLRRDATSALLSPLGLGALAFLGWSLVSIGWSEFKGVSLRAFGEFWLSVAAALVLGLTLARRISRPAFWLLAGGFVAACLMILIELGTGLAFRRELGVEYGPFIFNRSVLTLLVLTPPLAAWFLGHVRQGRARSTGLALLLAITVFQSESDAAALGLAAACIGGLAAWFAPRLTGGVMAAVLAAALIAAPYIGPISDRLIPDEIHETISQSHSRERVELWTSFGAAVQEQPLLGAGFGMSPRLGETPVAQAVPEGERRMLAIGHPHNAALQIWVELGAVGVALALVVILLLLCAAARQPRLFRSASLALIAGAATVALVGHGAWQGWWAASLGAAVTWMLAANRTRLETKP